MIKERKSIQDKLRKKYGYSTSPVGGSGTFLYKGQYDRDKAVTENLVYIEMGWHGEEKLFVTAAGHLSSKQGSIDSVVMTFEEIELLYKLTNALRKEWAQE